MQVLCGSISNSFRWFMRFYMNDVNIRVYRSANYRRGERRPARMIRQRRHHHGTATGMMTMTRVRQAAVEAVGVCTQDLDWSSEFSPPAGF